ncbi:MAG: hypothetical protein KBG83_08490 [Bacteroidetes bacterium]|jgi:hypothetical protein|nr:hypothetical protein [Bacteroidaceae bacterium]MBP8976738.1 hypothetical protein [Bacteroidota bacterium]
MESKLNDEHLLKCATEEAWNILSEEFDWTESLLEKYQENLNWKSISENRQIKWNLTMLDKFKERLHWDILSKEIHSEQITPEILEKFKDRWNWYKLSANWHIDLTCETIDKYAECWDWKELIDHRFTSNPYETDPIGFYEKYKKYIPHYILKDSSLWESIVNVRKEQLISTL